MKVFCDSDGVLKNFDKHFLDMFGMRHEGIPDDDMWEMIIPVADEFWLTMPLKYGAHKLWETLKPYNPTILTGCPKSHFELCAAHKVITHKRDFGDDVQIITCLSRDKPLYMEAPGDILIDDMSRNVRRWIKAGGRGVFYRNVEQAITDFKAMVE